MNKAEIIGIKRHCMGTDGHGITTLVAFHGCLLRCRYCLNPQCHSSFDPSREMTTEELADILKKDELYFIATQGGVTFGGGEPLLQSKYIADVLSLGGKKWHTTLETSLCAEKSHLERLLPWIDEYIVDVKDMNDKIYESYTGHKSTRMKENLQYLIEMGKADNILCRLPLIPGYNSESDRARSEDELIDMGITRFERFTYVKRERNMADNETEEGSWLTGMPFILNERKRIKMTLKDVRKHKEMKEKEKEFWAKLKNMNLFTTGIIVDEVE